VLTEIRLPDGSSFSSNATLRNEIKGERPSLSLNKMHLAFLGWTRSRPRITSKAMLLLIGAAGRKLKNNSKSRYSSRSLGIAFKPETMKEKQ
jgi:hypothetical protein